MFAQRLNPVTGKHEWVAAEGGADYDYTREIMRSQYGDMVHDIERVRC